jgi:hypothetical protein
MILKLGTSLHIKISEPRIREPYRLRAVEKKEKILSLIKDVARLLCSNMNILN